MYIYVICGMCCLIYVLISEHLSARIVLGLKLLSCYWHKQVWVLSDIVNILRLQSVTCAHEYCSVRLGSVNETVNRLVYSFVKWRTMDQA